MDSQDPAYHMDWIFGSGSNVHLASRKEWFTIYTPFKTTCHDAFGNPLAAVGVGEVTLRVKKHDHRKGNHNMTKLVLQDVLHVPTGRCNLVGGPIREQFDFKVGIFATADLKGGDGFYNKVTGGRVALLDHPRLWRLRLSGQTATETVLEQDTVHMIHARWTDAERARWHRQKATISRDQANLASVSTVQAPAASVSTMEADLSMLELANDDPEIPPHTQEEKHWLKKNFRGEFRFLRDYGLSIYKDEDREEGRQLLRALMEGDLADETNARSEKPRVEQESTSKEVGPDEEDEAGDDEEQELLREMDEHPEAHAADFHFSKEELAYIDAIYGCSANFLTSFGLKFDDVGDFREGKVILQQLMADDEEGEEEQEEEDHEDEEDEPEEENKFLRELEEHPESHAADYHFSENELEWIEKHYDYSSNFLMAFGLKFYDDEDCREGKMIVQQFMEDSEEEVEQEEGAEEEDEKGEDLKGKDEEGEDQRVEYEGVQYEGREDPVVRYERVQYEGVQYEGVQYEGVQYEGMQYEGMQYEGGEDPGVEDHGVEYEGVQYEGVYEGVEYEGVQYEGGEDPGVEDHGVEYEGVEYEGLEYEGGEDQGGWDEGGWDE